MVNSPDFLKKDEWSLHFLDLTPLYYHNDLKVPREYAQSSLSEHYDGYVDRLLRQVIPDRLQCRFQFCLVIWLRRNRVILFYQCPPRT